MLQKFERVFKQIDIYGQSIQLSFHKKNSYNTVFGGFISFAVLCSFIVSCWFFGKELYLKQNPSVIIQERSVNNPQRIDIRPDNLVIMMGIANNNAQYIYDPTIFSVNAVQQTQVYIQDPKTGKQTIQLVNQVKAIKQCSMSDIQIHELASYFQNLNYTALYCFDTEKDQVYFEGDFNQQAFSQLFVYFQKCQNSTSSQVICQPQEIIDKTLSLTKLSLFISDHIIDPLNFENPVSNRAISLYSVASSQFPQETDLFLTNYYIETDGGIFYQELKQQHTFVFASQTTTPLFGDPSILMKLNIRLQKFKENYMKRSYLKLADVVAQIGGLLKILILFGTIITNPISKLYYFKAIIDEIYQFQSTKKNVKLIPKNNQLSGNKMNETDLNQVKLPQNQQIKDSIIFQKNNDSENNFKKQIQIETPKVFLIFLNYFVHAFIPQCSWRIQDRNLLNKGIIKIQENFDILYIFNKLLEIDKMKSILFNQDQLNLFEYMPKPTINDESKKDETITTQNSQVENPVNPQDKDFQKSPKINLKQTKKKKKNSHQLRIKDETQMAKDAYEGLNNILNKKKLSKVDENLIKIIDPEFLLQVQQQKQSNLQDENELSNFSQIFKTHLVIQNPQGNIKKEIEQQYPSTGKNQSKFFQKNSINFILDQQPNLFEQTENEKQNQSQIKNPFLENSSHLQDSQYFINQNDISYQTNIQSIKKNDNKKFIRRKSSKSK
ncbi:hypothetical protein ABPG74_001478 [Tetrahymena malaccensis]